VYLILSEYGFCLLSYSLNEEIIPSLSKHNCISCAKYLLLIPIPTPLFEAYPSASYIPLRKAAIIWLFELRIFFGIVEFTAFCISTKFVLIYETICFP
jgi:hypothetical protein